METKKLTPVGKLIGNGAKLFFKGENFVQILKFIAIQILLLAAIAIPVEILVMISGISFSVDKIPSLNVILAAIPVATIFLIAAVIVGTWINISYVLAADQITNGHLLGVKETLSVAWKKIWKYLVVSGLGGLIVMLGFALVIIPGIIFMVLFGFATIIVVLTQTGAIDSLKKSKNLVSGYFWAVLGRFLVFGLLAGLISFVLTFIPVLGSFASILISPFFILLNVMLYKDLQKVTSGV